MISHPSIVPSARYQLICIRDILTTQLFASVISLCGICRPSISNPMKRSLSVLRTNSPRASSAPTQTSPPPPVSAISYPLISTPLSTASLLLTALKAPTRLAASKPSSSISPAPLNRCSSPSSLRLALRRMRASYASSAPSSPSPNQNAILAAYACRARAPASGSWSGVSFWFWS